MSRPSVTEVRFTPAGAQDRAKGLLGWITCRIGDLVLDGLAARRTREGRLALSFPARRDREGRQHAYVRPCDDATRQAIEREVLRAVGLEGER